MSNTKPLWIRLLAFGLAAGAFLALFFVRLEGLSLSGHITLSIFVMAAIFWMLEPVPIYATSLLVIFLQVLLLSVQGPLYQSGLLELDPIQYTAFLQTLAHPIIILFLGGFLLAGAAVKYQLDRALTRLIMRPFGSKPAFILLGLMLVTALLSAFMSNTATTAMMMTVILPVVAMLKPEDPLRIAVALAIPVGANIGGIATPIGTPPNAVVIAALAEQGVNIAFTSWMMLALPLVIVVLLFAWWLLVFLFPAQQKRLELNLAGKLDRSPRAILLYLVFGLTVALWLTETFHGIPSTIVAFMPVALLTVLQVVDKNDIRNLPWEVLWLVAGGISLGVAMQQTGLALWVVESIRWEALQPIVLIMLFGAVTLILANFLSHTVTATLIVPIAVGLGVSAELLENGFNPIIAGLVIAVSSSLGMVLPISTPPNAIAMSTGLVETRDMARTGVIIGLFGLVTTLLFAAFYWSLIYK